VEFPGGFMTPKVGPHRTYGFAPGTIFGRKADLIIRQGMIDCDNPNLEFITALSECKATLFVVAIHQAPYAAKATVKLDLSKIFPDAKWIGEEAIRGDVPGVIRTEGKMNLICLDWGMHVITVEIAE